MKQLAVPSFTVFREPRHDCAVRAARGPDNRSRQRPGRRRQSDNTDRHRSTERLLLLELQIKRFTLRSAICLSIPVSASPNLLRSKLACRLIAGLPLKAISRTKNYSNACSPRVDNLFDRVFDGKSAFGRLKRESKIQLRRINGIIGRPANDQAQTWRKTCRNRS